MLVVDVPEESYSTARFEHFGGVDEQIGVDVFLLVLLGHACSVLMLVVVVDVVARPGVGVGGLAFGACLSLFVAGLFCLSYADFLGFGSNSIGRVAYYCIEERAVSSNHRTVHILHPKVWMS